MGSEKKFNFILIFVLFIFSWWLFGKSFGYDGRQFRIARHQVGDFGLHLSIIRSISWANNFPPESPFFPGRPLPYHWGVDVVVGLLERIGIRIDLALNGISTIAMTALLYGIYQLSQTLFGRRRLVGLTAIALFLFPSTLTIIDYLKEPTNVWRLPDYLHKGPFDGSIISIYQTLNPYLNQRHLVVALAVAIFVINTSLHPLLIGLIIGLLYKIHSLVALSTLVVVLIYKKKFQFLFVAPAILLWSIFIFLEHPESPPVSFFFTPNFLEYWWMNAGVSMMLLPIGVYLAPNSAKRLFFSFLPLFIIANTVKLSFRIEHNHSLINFFWIGVSLFVAYALVKVFTHSKLIAILLFGFLISSGILNLMAVKNDYQAYFDDAPLWIKNNTNPDSIFLTTPTLYDPATLAGRFTYVGPSYYLEVIGYDFEERAQFARLFFENPEVFTKEARERGIDYVILSDGRVLAL